MSDDAYRQVRDKVDVESEDTGEPQFKNIARPVKVYRRGCSITRQRKSAPRALPDKPSIAVLPFQNMSGDPEQDYFADGVVEDIITGLSRDQAWLFVIARDHLRLQGPPAIDREEVRPRALGVRYVLKAACASRPAPATASPASSSTQKPARASGPSDTTVRSTTSSICRTRSPPAWSARWNQTCGAEIDRAKRKHVPIASTPTTSTCTCPSPTPTHRTMRARRCDCSIRRSACERAYAAAHGIAAWCHEQLTLARLQDEHKTAVLRHAGCDCNGGDDATACDVPACHLAGRWRYTKPPSTPSIERWH